MACSDVVVSRNYNMFAILNVPLMQQWVPKGCPSYQECPSYQGILLTPKKQKEEIFWYVAPQMHRCRG